MPTQTKKRCYGGYYVQNKRRTLTNYLQKKISKKQYAKYTKYYSNNENKKSKTLKSKSPTSQKSAKSPTSQKSPKSKTLKSNT